VYLEAVQDDPWKLLIAVMLLNKTSGKVALPVFWYIVNRWPTPTDLVNGERFLNTPLSQTTSPQTRCSIVPPVELDILEALLHHLGLSNTRARRLIALSNMYMEYPPNPRLFYKSKVVKDKTTIEYPPTHISHYPGSGKYALDSYRIFCMGKEEWKKVRSDDKELRRYLVSESFSRLHLTLTHVPAVEMGRGRV